MNTDTKATAVSTPRRSPTLMSLSSLSLLSPEVLPLSEESEDFAASARDKSTQTYHRVPSSSALPAVVSNVTSSFRDLRRYIGCRHFMCTW